MSSIDNVLNAHVSFVFQINGGENGPSGGESAFARKEKSVLQAKLTKLAIQIGYVGMLHYICTQYCRFHWSFERLHFITCFNQYTIYFTQLCLCKMAS